MNLVNLVLLVFLDHKDLLVTVEVQGHLELMEYKGQREKEVDQV